MHIEQCRLVNQLVHKQLKYKLILATVIVIHIAKKKVTNLYKYFNFKQFKLKIHHSQNVLQQLMDVYIVIVKKKK